MCNLVQPVTNIFLVAALLHQSQITCVKVILDLDERMSEFQFCNIRLTAGLENIEFETIAVPVALLHTEVRKGFGFMMYFWKTPINMVTLGFPFKYRESICSLDLIINLSNEPYNQDHYLHGHFQDYEYMEDKYLVIVQQEAPVFAENHKNTWNEMEGLKDHKIFIWTITIGFVKNIRFSQILFICSSCDIPNSRVETEYCRWRTQ